MSDSAELPSASRVIAEGRLIAQRRKNHELLIGSTAETAAAADRFDRFLRDMISQRGFEGLPATVLLIASVLAFERVEADELASMLDAMADAMAMGDGVYVSWMSGEEVRRCRLSHFTVLANAKADHACGNWTEVVANFNVVAGRLYAFQAGVRVCDRTKAITADAKAWDYLHLPMPLVAHLTGEIATTYVPDIVWRRRFQLPAPPIDAQESPVADLEAVEEAAIETLYQGKPQLSGAWFIEELTALCAGLTGPGVAKSNAHAWREIVGRLQALSRKVAQAGPGEALLLGWALDIAVFGTAKRRDPRVKTLANYLKSAVRLLHRRLREHGGHPLSLGAYEWEQIFLDLLDARKDDVTLKPALASFQRYLVRSLDADPIPWLWKSATEVRAPRANVVWPHEFDRMPAALQGRAGDVRTGDQLQVWNALLRSTTLRFGELAGLQVRSVRDHGTALEIEVAPHRGHRPLKSPAARRILPIQHAEAAALIRQWHQRRQTEGAGGDQLLFGDPHEPDCVYKLGSCYRIYSGALKDVCGDADVTVHSTRHAAVSNLVEAAISGMDRFSSVNPLHVAKVAAGHRSEETTISTYAHLFEDPLRLWLDRSLKERFTRCVDAAKWIGCSAERLRQRLHRHSQGGWNLWADLSGAAASACSPAKPEPSPAASSADRSAMGREANFLDFVRLAGDLVDGYNADAVSLRNAVDRESVAAAAAALCNATILRRASLVGPRHPRELRSQLNFSRLSKPRWRALASLLREAETRSNVVPTYPFIHKGGVIMETAFASRAVLIALRDAGFEASAFVLRFSRQCGAEGDSKPVVPDGVRAALREFRLAFNAEPQVEAVLPRRGRPGIYLQVLTHPINGDRVAPAAANDTPSLRAVVAAAAAYELFLQSRSHHGAQCSL